MSVIFNFKKTDSSPLYETRKIASKLHNIDPKYAISDNNMIIGFNNSTL